jgi:hypothetical protein
MYFSCTRHERVAGSHSGREAGGGAASLTFPSFFSLTIF